MKIKTYFILFAILGWTLLVPPALARDMSSYSNPVMIAPGSERVDESYGTTVGRKMGSGLSNMAMGWIEIPKSALNVTNDIDTRYVVFGFVGGLIKGTLHAVGRTLTGVGDFVTSPIPTKPMIRSSYVWDDFHHDTTYGPYFQLTESQEAEK